MKGKKLAILSALSASVLIISGCSSGSDESSGVAIEVPDIPMHEAMGEFEGELNIVNWSGFVEPAWTDKFTADTCIGISGTSIATPELSSLPDEHPLMIKTDADRALSIASFFPFIFSLSCDSSQH